jgi:phosphomevalonate kinase
MEFTTVSAPGKVLFAGGYLVLDQQHTGLVFGLNARIHVHIQRPESDDHDLALANQVSVRSPQFKDAVWVYGYSTDQDYIRVEQVQS